MNLSVNRIVGKERVLHQKAKMLPKKIKKGSTEFKNFAKDSMPYSLLPLIPLGIMLSIMLVGGISKGVEYTTREVKYRVAKNELEKRNIRHYDSNDKEGTIAYWNGVKYMERVNSMSEEEKLNEILKKMSEM